MCVGRDGKFLRDFFLFFFFCANWSLSKFFLALDPAKFKAGSSLCVGVVYNIKNQLMVYYCCLSLGYVAVIYSSCIFL